MRSRYFLLPLLVVPLTVSGAKGTEAVTVSPGDMEIPTLVTGICPTFSWAPAPEAQTYEVAVFELLQPPAESYEEQRAWADPILSQRLPAPALSWTPPAADCLAQGGAYVWYVRGIDAAGSGDWSQGYRFEVDVGAAVDAFEEAIAGEVSRQLSAPRTIEQILTLLRERSAYAGATWPIRAPAAGAPREPIAAAAQVTGLPTAPAEGAVVLPRAALSYPNPSAFRISSPNGVVFDDAGTGLGTGPIPVQGSGARFMWYTGKRALRAGYVPGTEWDDANIGDYSIAMGHSTTASGSYSTAMGGSTTASGYASIAMGIHTTAESGYETVVGRYDTDYTPASTTAWNSADRLFVIGNGTGTSSRSNALVVLKNGNVGIGHSTPGYQLQLSTNSAAKPGSSAWTIASDERLKDVGEPYARGLADIARLRPVRFRYNAGNARGYDPRQEYVGFVAQQVQPVFPEAVSEADDGYLDFDMHAINVAMVNAVGELKEQNERLRADNEALKALVCQDHPRASLCL